MEKLEVKMTAEFKDLNANFKDLNAKMTADFKDVNAKMTTGFNDVNAKIDKLSEIVFEMNEKLSVRYFIFVFQQISGARPNFWNKAAGLNTQGYGHHSRNIRYISHAGVRAERGRNNINLSTLCAPYFNE